jgi:RNA polymerase-binding transcription factor DksA
MARIFRTFASFPEAAAFAKDAAREKQCTVSLSRQDNEWLVATQMDELQTMAPESPPPLNARPPLTTNHLSTNSQAGVKLQMQRSNAIPENTDSPSPRNCIVCGVGISTKRIEAYSSATRCITCQSEYEQYHDTRPRIDEGLPGTREAHTKMRGQLWGELRNRGRGNE